jgi:hypothetical protein
LDQTKNTQRKLPDSQFHNFFLTDKITRVKNKKKILFLNQKYQNLNFEKVHKTKYGTFFRKIRTNFTVQTFGNTDLSPTNFMEVEMSGMKNGNPKSEAEISFGRVLATR